MGINFPNLLNKHLSDYYVSTPFLRAVILVNKTLSLETTVTGGTGCEVFLFFHGHLFLFLEVEFLEIRPMTY